MRGHCDGLVDVKQGRRRSVIPVWLDFSSLGRYEPGVGSIVTLVLCRVAAATLLSVQQKALALRGVSALSAVSGMYLASAIVALPGVWISWDGAIQPPFWRAVLIAGGFDALGNIFLLLSLQRTDLSIFGPLNAFKSVFALIASFFLLGEIPSVAGTVGVLIVVLSSLLLIARNDQPRTQRPHVPLVSVGVWFRLLGIACFVLGAPYLKVSALTGPLWLAFYGWVIVGVIVTGVGLVVVRRISGHGGTMRELWSLAQYPGVLCGLALLHVMMQLATLAVLRETLVGYALALFQLGVLLQVIAGRAIFGEPDFARRLIAALMMVGGSCLIIFCG